MQRSVAEHRLAAKAFCQPVGDNNVVAADAFRLKAKSDSLNLAVGNNKLLLDSVNLLELAFGGFDVLLPVPLPLLSHNALKTLYLLHIRFVFILNRLLLGLLFYKEFGIITPEATHLAIFKLHGLVRYFIEEITVMGYYKYCTVIIFQEVFEPLNRFDVEVVSRLVKQQKIVL